MAAIGADPVRFGLIMAPNLTIGPLTPPVSMALHVLARVSGLSFEQTTRACAPFLVPLSACSAPAAHWEGPVMWPPTLIHR